MSSSSRDKLNTLWFWFALVAALIAGNLFGSFFVAAIVFVTTFIVLLNTGNVRFTPRNNRPYNGRSR